MNGLRPVHEIKQWRLKQPQNIVSGPVVTHEGSKMRGKGCR